ncbi:MAG: arginine decarboxylase, partial [Xanthomonadales bacterium]|nr:arginine decarboxylase [Xanthomonadales bacterium]
RVDGSGFKLSNARRGDSCDRVLGYVGFAADDLRAAFAAKVAKAQVDAGFAQRIAADLEAGLTAYTYLEETPHA